ncbi:DUF7000 family protein [Mycoplasma sp. P36-A1]|uniref:DUF7000 family protein n=1 Tax=Mycoplasma sp. P36-A1 TaxID=3252900 RepID=UPI003C2E20B7
MEKDINKSIKIYKDYLKEGYIQDAYKALTKYIALLKADFCTKYKTGNISFGYLDYTYFAFYNDYLRNKGLRFGIVLNHKEMQIELWLMARNEVLHQEYWNILKDTKWNKNVTNIPKYSVLEVVLENNINFNNKELMTKNIIDSAVDLTQEIEEYIKNNV